MQTVKDTDGSLWKVYKVIPGKAHNHMGRRWLEGDIKVRVR